MGDQFRSIGDVECESCLQEEDHVLNKRCEVLLLASSSACLP